VEFKYVVEWTFYSGIPNNCGSKCLKYLLKMTLWGSVTFPLFYVLTSPFRRWSDHLQRNVYFLFILLLCVTYCDGISKVNLLYVNWFCFWTKRKHGQPLSLFRISLSD